MTNIALTVNPTVDGNPFTIQSCAVQREPATLLQATDTEAARSGVLGRVHADRLPGDRDAAAPRPAEPVRVDAPVNASTGTAQTAAVQGPLPDVKGTFIAGPSTKQILATPSLATTFNFTYADSAATSSFVFGVAFLFERNGAEQRIALTTVDGTYTCTGLANGAGRTLVSTSTAATPDTGEAVCEDLMAMTYDGSGNQTTSSANCQWVKNINAGSGCGRARKSDGGEGLLRTVGMAGGVGSGVDRSGVSGRFADRQRDGIANTWDDPVDGAWTTESNLAVKLYLIPAQSPTELAKVGAIVFLSGSPVTGVLGSATLLPNGQVHLVFNNFRWTAVLNSAWSTCR